MTAAIFTPPALDPTKAHGGRAGANAIVHGRAPTEFHDLLCQTGDRKLEMAEKCRDMLVTDDRFRRTELPDGSKGYIRNGFAVGPNGEITEGGKT